MNFSYIDESEGIANDLAYTSVTAAVFNSSIIHDFQHDLSLEINKLYFPQEIEKNIVHTNPIFHASDLPREHSDEVNLAVVETISKIAMEYGVEIIRTGYFDESYIGGMGETRYSRLDSCLSNIKFPLQALARQGMCYVYELDGPSHSKIKNYGNGNLVDTAATLNEESISYLNYDKMLGSFYCEKHNHCMYIADLAAYLLKIRGDPERTDFKREYLNAGSDLLECVLIDEIIYWNDKSKLVSGPSKGLISSRHYYGTRKWRGTIG